MDINILDLFDRTVAHYPDKTAIADDKRSLTFAQWQAQAQAIGTHLATVLDGATNCPIMVFVDRKIDGLIGFLGVTESGNFYVPIDCKMPLERIKVMVETLNPPAAVVVTEKDVKLLEEIGYQGVIVLLAEAIETSPDLTQLANIREGIIDLDPVYAIFTSGSTGVPKGVVMPHRGFIDFAYWLSQTFDFSSADNLGNQSPFYFDGSVKDICLCITTGATLNVIGKKYISFPKLLIDYMNERKVTSILWATSAVILIGNSDILSVNKPKYLNKVFFGGEAMPAKQLNVWMRHFPDALYVNVYGPTETAVDCTYFVVDHMYDENEYIPIGRACRNKGILLLTEDNKLAKPGEPGEICVRGSGVSLGYYNHPEKTHEVFTQNPLNPHYLDLIYRTGDIARYDEDGNLRFVSRKDFQIKHMGNRIELGEIEAAVNSIDGVTNAACIYDLEGRRIVLYYTTADGNEIDVINHVKSKIPKYMFPNIVNHLAEMPYSMNRKIDRVTLKQWYEGKRDK